MQPPKILDAQEVIVQWARKLRSHYIDVPSIIKILMADKLSKDMQRIMKNFQLNEETEQAREAYNRYNSEWKNSVLLAIQLDAYRKKNDMKERQIVTDGKVVGFAFNLDYHARTFELFSSNPSIKETYLGTFPIDDFYVVK
jgi:hypothetical protein